MQSDAEHQKNDADFRKFGRERCIDLWPGRVRADEDAGDEVADERRQAELARDESGREREHEPEHDRDEK